MRSRNIKPDFFKNEVLAECDPLARILFIGLWCMADRDGFIEYRPKKIGADLLPYDSRNVEKFLDQLSTHGFITIWCVYRIQNEKKEKRPFAIEIPNFKKHQNPHKNEKPSNISHLFNDPEISRNFTKLHEIYQTDPADSLLLIPDSGYLIPEDSSEQILDSEPSESPPSDPPVVTIPLVKKDGEFEIHQDDIDEWQEDFPAVDVLQTVKIIRQWNIANPKKRKTATGIKQHITSWLAREQNKGHPNQRSSPLHTGRSETHEHNLRVLEQTKQELFG